VTLAISPTFMHRATPILRRLRGVVRPRHTRFYLYCRELGRLETPDVPADVQLVSLGGAGGEHYEALVDLCLEHGLDEDWVAEQFAAGSTASLALAGGEPAGFIFLTCQAFYVSEIAHTFNPGLGGSYVYALYLRPRHRGRGLARLLEASVLVHGRDACGARTTYGLIESTNFASLRLHAALGFVPALRINLLHVSPRHVLAHLRRVSPSRPLASLVPNGFHVAPSLHLVHPD
jgi:GNAT superfamily N-acetyltransferase